MPKRINILPSLETLRAHFDLNAETGVLTWRQNEANKFLNKRLIGAAAGSRAQNGYLRVKISGGSHMVHRIVFKMHHNKEPEGEVDHINLDVSDNRPLNLREATAAENTWNKANKRRVRSDLPKGVCYHRRSGRFRARIQKAGRRYELGDYATPQEAAVAYAEASSQHHGAFGRAE